MLNQLLGVKSFIKNGVKASLIPISTSSKISRGNDFCQAQGPLLRPGELLR